MDLCWNYCEKIRGICQLEYCFKIVLKHPTGTNITDNISIKHYSMAQFKTGSFPLIRSYLQLYLTLCGPSAILHMFLTYIFYIYNVILNYLFIIMYTKKISVFLVRYFGLCYTQQQPPGANSFTSDEKRESKLFYLQWLKEYLTIINFGWFKACLKKK